MQLLCKLFQFKIVSSYRLNKHKVKQIILKPYFIHLKKYIYTNLNSLVQRRDESRRFVSDNLNDVKIHEEDETKSGDLKKSEGL